MSPKNLLSIWTDSVVSNKNKVATLCYCYCGSCYSHAELDFIKNEFELIHLEIVEDHVVMDYFHIFKSKWVVSMLSQFFFILNKW